MHKERLGILEMRDTSAFEDQSTTLSSQAESISAANRKLSGDSAPTKPRISVVIPTHNRPDLLREALASVRSQTLTSWEVIIVDDQSDPPVDQTTFGFSENNIIRVIRTDRPSSCAGSKATGALAAQGEYITFLDDDDRYHPDLLQRVVDVMEAAPHLETLFIGVEWFGEDAQIERSQHEKTLERILSRASPKQHPSGAAVFGGELLNQLVEGIPMPFQRPAYRRSTLERVGVHRYLPCLGDCDMALRAAMKSRCALLNEGLYQQRCDHQGFFSRPDRQMQQLTSQRNITHYLLGRAIVEERDRCTVRALTKGAARDSYSLAYAYSRQGNIQDTIASWWEGMRLCPSSRACRLPIAALLRRFGFK